MKKPLCIFLFSISATIFSCENNDVLIRNAIENESQVARLNTGELDRASGIYHDVRSEIATTPNTLENLTTLNRLANLIARMDRIDEATGKMIRMIDDLKLQLLAAGGENVNFNPGNPERILQEKKDPERPVFPVRLNLAGIQSAGKIIDNAPAAEMLGQLKGFKLKLVEILGTYAENGRQWSIHAKEIGEFKNPKELRLKVDQMIRSNKVNPVDENTIKEIYCLLTEQNGTEKYNDLPLVTVIGNLSLLQNKLLAARSRAFSQISSGFNRMADGLMFNESRVIAYGPDVVKRGDEIQLQIVVAAFETGAQHVESNLGTVSYEKGVPVISLKPGKENLMKVKGTLDIKNKSGGIMKYPWEKTIEVTD